MSTHHTMQNVGAPDPEYRTSPIFDEADDEYLSLDRDMETGVCYFNGAAYRIGQYICSGDELLRCAARGIWVREGECERD